SWRPHIRLFARAVTEATENKFIFSVPLRPAAFTAECATVCPSRAEHVRQVLSTARATLARSRPANDEYQFREPVDAPNAPERARGRPLAPRDPASTADITVTDLGAGARGGVCSHLWPA